MKKVKDFNTEEAFDYIAKRLRIKYSDSNINGKTRRTVRKLNTLNRIHDLLMNTTFKAKYPYLKDNVNKADNHYWIDFWVGDTLLTIDYDRVLPASMDTVI